VASAATRVRRNAYIDSVTLLQLSAEVQALAGVEEAALVMASDLNRDLLRDSGLLVGDATEAGPNDLVLAVRAVDDATAQAALDGAVAFLSSRRSASAASDALTVTQPRSLRGARRAAEGANLAVISVPGQFAVGEARQALADGLHVFLFSDNVPIEDEIDLKQRGRSDGLLVMGPDCGTAILNGVGLGFANAVRRGSVGLIGASGTGIQEISTLVHQAGGGVSHAIGTGGRDLDARVGGITTLQALDLLRDDPATGIIVLVSKTPDPDVAAKVLSVAAECGKPVVACLIGHRDSAPAGVHVATSLWEAAALATGPRSEPAFAAPMVELGAGVHTVRGLYCGGTLAEETEAVLVARGAPHEVIDFGDDRYTRGRAHPMIDPTLRNAAIVEAGADPSVAVLLLDVMLGLGSHADPAGATVPALREARARAEADGRTLALLAHIVGTDGDAQGLARQQATLRAAGVQLYESNHHAALAAALVLG
jgi:FdrA protein